MADTKGILCYKGEDVIELMFPQGTKLKEIRVPSSQQVTGTVWDVYFPRCTGDYVFSYSILTVGEMGVKKRFKTPSKKVKTPLQIIGEYDTYKCEIYRQ